MDELIDAIQKEQDNIRNFDEDPANVIIDKVFTLTPQTLQSTKKAITEIHNYIREWLQIYIDNYKEKHPDDTKDYYVVVESGKIIDDPFTAERKKYLPYGYIKEMEI